MGISYGLYLMTIYIRNIDEDMEFIMELIY